MFKEADPFNGTWREDTVADFNFRLHCIVVCLAEKPSQHQDYGEYLSQMVKRLELDADQENWRLWQAAMLLAGYEPEELVRLLENEI